MNAPVTPASADPGVLRVEDLVTEIATARGIVLSPRRTGTDGFYISVMRRQ